jgi:hypothetical protein
MNWLRTTSLYTLLLFVATVAAGFVWGIVRRVVGLEHQWGVLDAAAAIGVAITFAVAFGVFSALARRHPDEYYSFGAGVVFLSAILSTVSAYYIAPLAARDAHNWAALVVWPLLFQIIALVLAKLLLRFRKSSSNTSLERTREG